MLNIQFGETPGAVYDTAAYFAQAYQPEWITDELSMQMIRDVDKSEVLGARIIESPVLGPIPPTQLSGGVKTLILMAHDRSNVYNASTCGDNCAKWILTIADLYAKRRRKLLVNLYHLMDFGEGPFKIRVLGPAGDDLGVATDMVELLRLAGDYV